MSKNSWHVSIIAWFVVEIGERHQMLLMGIIHVENYIGINIIISELVVILSSYIVYVGISM